MNDRQKEIVAEMKSDLLSRVEEWVGFDIPEEDSEDYELWQDKLAQIEDVHSLGDVIEYLESERDNVADFFVCGEYALVSAGMRPEQVPAEVVEGLGEQLSESAADKRRAARAYSYDGYYFVCSKSAVLLASKDRDAALALLRAHGDR